MNKFAVLAGITALGVFGLIIMGGVVRVSESGLGCPDWPLCHGNFTPPLERTALIEYSHRMLVTVEGFLVLCTAVVAWRHYKNQRWVLSAAVAALVLIFIQAGLGGATVKAELDAELVTAHLGLAMIFFACTIATVVSLRRPAQLGDNGRSLLPWISVAGIALLSTMLIGAYIGSSSAGLACPDLPICDGTPIPLDDRYVQAHMWHRGLAVLTTLIVLATLVQALRLRVHDSLLKSALSLAGISVLLQVFLGAINVWLRIPEPIVVAHLGNGAFLWAMLVIAGLRTARGEVASVPASRAVAQPARG